MPNCKVRNAPVDRREFGIDLDAVGEVWENRRADSAPSLVEENGLETAVPCCFANIAAIVPATKGESSRGFSQEGAVKPKKILTAGPTISQREIDYVVDAVQNGWNENWSGYLTRFERSFADYVGARFALATSSCTGALHLSLLALGIGAGDEVLVPEVTWIATASAVTYTGAKPVFVDIDPATWCMDPAAARRAITPRTKAIMPVHLYGHPTDMKGIDKLAQEYGLLVLEDAAPALGAEIEGRKVGSFGHLACFSFQGAKIMTCGEGGMLVTSDPALYERARYMNDHGRDPQRAFVNTAIGYKYKMSNLQAALGLAQLERIEEMIAKRRQTFQWYRQRIGEVPGLTLNVERFWARNIYWMTSIVLSDELSVSRDEVMAGLKQRDIDSRPFFLPISSFPMFESRAAENPVAYQISHRGINLPSGHNLTETDIDRICRSLLEVLGVSSQKHREAA
ncbi:MAG TPA: DegT/DnrJ/EryC1/StrS family aminotransferase [Pirellulales bacterium]|nr:DegT/DnrJ/EryC1/StrS family aminotransferase [Pirellulales bacterium]